RALAKSPAFSLAAIVILGLGIGVNTAIFSVVNAIVLRPLPFPESSRVMRVWHTPPAEQFSGRRTFAVSPANYIDWRDQNDVFDRVRFPIEAELWVPLVWTAKDRAVRGNHNYVVIARLKPGVDVPRAQADMTTISNRLEQQYPADDKGWGALVLALHEDLVGDVRWPLLVLLGAVAFVLLIACANLANLL